jgi:tetratricopeptide (TPR) repeat protein
MATTAVIDTQDYTDFFHSRILVNARYWQDYVARNLAALLALDSERERILTAISFALDMEDAWSVVYKLIVNFSPYMERRGDWGVWNQLLKRAIQAAQRAQDVTSSITLSALLARLLQRQSRLGEAISQYRQTIRLARRTQNHFEEARACSNLGYLYVELGYWHRAEVLCYHALAIFELINSDHGRAHTENHLGYLYTRQHLPDRARDHLERACGIWESMGDQHGLMRGFINLSSLCVEEVLPDEALCYLQKALDLAKLTGEEGELGAIYGNMGIANRLKGQLSEAERYLQQAEAIFRRSSNTGELVRLWNNLGMVYSDQARWQEAETYLEASLEASRRLSQRDSEIRTLLDIVESKLQQADWQKAATRLNEAEKLLARYQDGRYDQLEERLLEYCRRLAGYASRPTAAG